MADYIEREKVMAEINRIGGHNLCEWDTIGVKALIDRQPTEDVVPRSEVEGYIVNMNAYGLTAKRLAEKNEQLQKQLNDYKRVCGELYFTESGNAVFNVKETEITVEYVPAKINDIRVREAKQEVAREIFAEIKKLLDFHSYTNFFQGEICPTSYFEKDLEDSIAELEKKHIGEKK